MDRQEIYLCLCHRQPEQPDRTVAVRHCPPDGSTGRDRYAGKSGRRVASAFIATAFAQETAEAASSQWRAVADQIRPKVPKLATIMDEVIQHFNLKSDTHVTIKIDIEAKSTGGFDESTQRTIRENCRTLKFDVAEFEEE